MVLVSVPCCLPTRTFAQLEQSDQSECCQDVSSSPISLELKLTIPRDEEVVPSTQSCSDVSHQELTITVTFELFGSYPELSPPVIVLSSECIVKESLNKLQHNVLAYAHSQRPEPCLFSILEMLKDSTLEMIANDPSCLAETSSNHPPKSRNLQSYQGPPASYPGIHASNSIGGKCTSGSSSKCMDPTVCVAKIDNMRNEQKYFKILKSWTKELDIGGKVLNTGLHDIYVVVVGSNVSVSELLRRWRSQNVDVDSQGKPCKEKMMSILYRQKVDQPLSCRLDDLFGAQKVWSRFITLPLSLSLSSLSMPGLQLVHCSKAELASHFNSETCLLQAYEKCVQGL